MSKFKLVKYNNYSNASELYSIKWTNYNIILEGKLNLYSCQFNYNKMIQNQKLSQPLRKISTTVLPDKASITNYVKDQKMIEALRKKGIKSLMPIQYQTFATIYQGEHIIARDRTGSGKTIAFALPCILQLMHRGMFKNPRRPKFLVILPTRQLALQVLEQINSLRCNQNDFYTLAVYGGKNMQEQIAALNKGVDIIVGTPGRIKDLLERKALNFDSIEIVCLDEADEMLNIGFKQEIQKIFAYIMRPYKKVQCLMFSATIPDWIWKISSKYQSQNTKFVNMIREDNVQTSKIVDHYCMSIDDSEKEYYIGGIISDFFGEKKGKILIFCQTKREVERIGTSGNVPVPLEMLHGDFQQFERQKVFYNFKNGRTQCLIATNVAARGLDFPHIDLIIQLHPPSTTDSYIHRSGRTGRINNRGACVTLYSWNEEYLIGRIQMEAKIKMERLQASNFKSSKPAKSNMSYHEWRDKMY